MKKQKKLETETEIKKEKEETKEVKEINEVTAPLKVTKVGSLLKNMRQEKGAKIVDIAKKLCIRRQYLEAIEDSNYSEIPPFPYGVGFIRAYADFLGLNSGNIVELYKEETTEKKPMSSGVTEPQNTSGMPGGIYILASLAALGILYGAWVMWNNSDENGGIEGVVNEQIDENNELIVFEELSAIPEAEDESITETKSEDTISTQEVVSSEETIQEPVTENKVADTIAETSKDDVKEAKKDVSDDTKNIVVPDKGVFVEVLEETWIEVRNETKLYLSKVLFPGNSYTLPNDKGLILSVGKLGGVNVYVNGAKTDIARVGKKMNIDIDSYLSSNH